MEALAPRDANTVAYNRGKQTAQKTKTLTKTAPVAKLTSKEKDHPAPPPDDVLEPASSDRKNGAVYHMGRLLGKGGFAICYEGRLAGTRQKYALKIVKSYMPQKKMEQKFQTELQIHSKMNHPNIVKFHRAFAYEKCTYIVLELCPSGSLMDMVKKRKYITEPEVRFYTIQLAGAIKYMHAKGIIHRDLKMGNVFLDKDMNVKVGDFGLAALLMSGKDMTACRRTTLCGTPNYIAPEILEKNKGGHDHTVDIWSLGIIIFALLTGKPPFQSQTADEIYRRARERDYDWPKLETSENYISEEVKDLVALMLREPALRPEPDHIVQHPFFTCGWMPRAEEMSPEWREGSPDSNQFISSGSNSSKASLYKQNLKKLCMQCEVGPWGVPKKHTSTYREVAAEEKAGLTPQVPLAEDVVYRCFDEWKREQKKLPIEEDDLLKPALEMLERTSSRKQELPPMARSTNTQSFAAQQRAKAQPAGATLPNRSIRTRQIAADGVIDQPGNMGSTGSSLRNIMSSVRQGKTSLHRPVSEPPKNEVGVEERLAADMVEQLQKVETERKAQEAPKEQLSTDKPVSLFNPKEELEWLPGTEPNDVLARLRRLEKELERALNSRSIASTPTTIPNNYPIVVKWVDYTTKFGLGYILSNGSVGCIFRNTFTDLPNSCRGVIPPSCVVVRDAEYHLQNKNNPDYLDRQQIVPISGPNIEFYENRAEAGFFRGRVNPMNYKVTVPDNGESAKLLRGRDAWDDRKREKIVLWKKFANYMSQYGRDGDYPSEDAVAKKPDGTSQELVAPGNVVTFYQRWGDVGCWYFGDGHFQFNFPDHTKIVISADGTWCDFYHLPLEAARDLSENGTIASNALDDRQHLSYPLQTLLNFMAKPSRTSRNKPVINPMIQGIPQANDFRKKVEFIKTCVKEWTKNNGIGISDMDPSTRLRWCGKRELVNVRVPYKHVWTTVGSKNGDERRVAWFDPRNPAADIPDVM
ncbi:serine kinase-2 [Coleophoma cylindrospora]|uniref:Serine/threonine-protein kinase ATG1 n=1 Tax=Coleophoma cylindrospora TaxID=1849047 RepID=A0A3D8SFA8_9HELO|nr:serine kinase-2 [Coleophoma cylindrospora]